MNWTLIKSINEDKDQQPKKLMPGEMDEIQKNIRKGAKDLDQQWKSAAHLTNKAYEVSKHQVPTPIQQDLWAQYFENIQRAVELLKKYRGLENDWRLTNSPFE